MRADIVNNSLTRLNAVTCNGHTVLIDLPGQRTLASSAL